MIDIIIAPDSAPQIYRPPLNGVGHPLAGKVFDAVRRHSTPVSIWKIVNNLADAQGPASRAHRRSWRLRFLCALRELLRVKVLHRHGPLVSTANFAIRPKPRSPKRLLPSVAGSVTKTDGSSRVTATPETARSDHQVPAPELVAGDQTVLAAVAQAKSATPTPAEISAAASALARRPRRLKRPWTGYLAGERVKRGWLVQVPSGEILPAYVVLRGKVLVALPDEPRYADRVFDRYDADQVHRVKLPEARLLGSLKAGTKEVFSLSKQEAARANGRLPPRPGRQRGRRKSRSEVERL